MKKRKIITALIAVLLILLALIIGKGIYKSFSEKLERELYPLPEKYLTEIKKYSQEYKVPVEILCGVINTESSFNPNAYSHAGAMGIMQITEPTFEWLNFKTGEEHKLEELYDYKFNIRYGTLLLSLLYDEFQNWDTTLAAYNAGRGRVNEWLSDSEYSEDGKLTNIPYKETSDYVKKVNKASEIYTKLYFTSK